MRRIGKPLDEADDDECIKVLEEKMAALKKKIGNVSPAGLAKLRQ